MRVIHSSDITAVFEPCVATVGIFDGIHAGHRYLIDELRTLASDREQKSTVITFSKQPRRVLNPDAKVDLITTLDEKLALLEQTGVDTCLVLDFTREMAALSAQEFIADILFKQFNVHGLLVGHDHRFGHNRTDGFEEYQQYGRATGMEVFQAVRYRTDSDPEISSTEIRSALLDGDIARTNRMLLRPYSLRGKVVEGFQVGRTIGFPTANIHPNHPDKLIPRNGVYHVNILINGEIFEGMMNIGNRPTLNNGSNVSIEVNIFDFDKDIYGENVEILFLKRIRDEKKFSGLNNLISQLKADKELILKLNK